MMKRLKNKVKDYGKPAVKRPNTSKPIANRPIVLVIDDEKMVHTSLAETLKGIGFTSAHAYNSKEVTAQLEKYMPRVVLLDIFMPGVNTLEILQGLRAFPHLKDVPVIVISGTNNINAIASYLNQGANEFLLKPFHPALLKVRLRSVLERAKPVKESDLDSEAISLKEQVHQLKSQLHALEKEHAQCAEGRSGFLDAETESNLRILVHEANDKLNRAMAMHKQQQGKFEHDLNNVMLAMSTADQMLKKNSSE